MMGFSDRQIRALQRSVSARHLRTRTVDGKELSYVEGWFAIAEANRIFGFDGWDRETVETKCIRAGEARGSYNTLYSARVRVSVRAADHLVVRDGHGTGEGRGNTLSEAHDVAIKAAETDATKRALVTFGKAFGLALYSPSARSFAHAGASKIAERGPAEQVSAAAGHASANVTTTDLSIAGGGRSPENARGGVWKAPLQRSNLGAARIDKSVLTFSEPRRLRDKQHLQFVGSQPCAVCGGKPADAHHIRFAQKRAFGAKVSDEFTVPLCRQHHRELHNYAHETAWWHDVGIDPLPIARDLWEQSHEESGFSALRPEAGLQSGAPPLVPASQASGLVPTEDEARALPGESSA